MDKIKEKISYLKLLLTTAFAFIAGCIAWLFNNINSLSNLIYLDMMAILALAGLILVLLFEIKFNINKLGD